MQHKEMEGKEKEETEEREDADRKRARWKAPCSRRGPGMDQVGPGRVYSQALWGRPDLHDTGSCRYEA